MCAYIQIHTYKHIHAYVNTHAHIQTWLNSDMVLNQEPSKSGLDLDDDKFSPCSSSLTSLFAKGGHFKEFDHAHDTLSLSLYIFFPLYLSPIFELINFNQAMRIPYNHHFLLSLLLLLVSLLILINDATTPIDTKPPLPPPPMIT